MKKYFWLLAFGLFVTGFGVWAATPASGLEGEYVDESDGSTLTITADHWKTKGLMEDDELYTAKKTGEDSYDVVLTMTDPALKGQKLTAIARKEGNFLFVKLEGSNIEVKWKKK
jgi:hypothetical protein